MEYLRCRTHKVLLLAFLVTGLASSRGFSQTAKAVSQQADPPPESAVVLEPCLGWQTSPGWTIGKGAEDFAHDFSGKVPRFSVNEPKKSMVWTRPLRLPIPAERYPILVFKYRAWNIGVTGWHYVLWLDDGTGPWDGGLYVVRLNDIIADGKVHEIRRELWNFDPQGPIKFIAISVY